MSQATLERNSTMLSLSQIQSILGDSSDYLLNHTSSTISKDRLHLPSPTFIDDVFSLTNRNNQVLRNLSSIYNHGRLAGTGYVSILPVDQGIEHSAGASFAPNPDYFDPDPELERRKQKYNTSMYRDNLIQQSRSSKTLTEEEDLL